MTNTLAFWLAGLIALALGLDAYLYDWQGTMFLGRKLMQLIDWLAFWR